MQYVVYSWIHFCMNVFPGLLMWRQTSSRRLCPQNSPEETLWPTTADPSLSTSWMSTSANYTTYLRRQERAWWGKHFLTNVNATCVCSSLVHRLTHFCFFPQNGAVPHDNLVLIKMRPDENGRFGFNVKVRFWLFNYSCTFWKLKSNIINHKKSSSSCCFCI